jgi:hypothetical protein
MSEMMDGMDLRRRFGAHSIARLDVNFDWRSAGKRRGAGEAEAVPTLRNRGDKTIGTLDWNVPFCGVPETPNPLRLLVLLSLIRPNFVRSQGLAEKAARIMEQFMEQVVEQT